MVLFQNRQWEVTNGAVKAKPPTARYEIAIKQLSETTERNGQIYYDFPVHMAEKEWVDIEAFIEAFCNALTLCAGKYSPALDQDMLEASIKYARKQAARRGG